MGCFLIDSANGAQNLKVKIMKIVIRSLEQSTIDEFAQKHNLTMIVTERTQKNWIHGRFYAMFDGCEVKDGVILSSAHGNGDTPNDAIADYANEISEKLLVFNASNKNRKEIHAPIFAPC